MWEPHRPLVAALLHVTEDLGASLGEGQDGGAVEAGDVGLAVGDRTPLDAQVTR